MSSAQLTDLELAHALVALQSPMQLLKLGSKTRSVKAWISADWRSFRWSSRWRQNTVSIGDFISVQSGSALPVEGSHRSPTLNQVCFQIQYATSILALHGNRSDSPSRFSLSCSVSDLAAQGVVQTLTLACKDDHEWIMWTAVLEGLHRQTISESVLDKARQLAQLKQSGSSATSSSHPHDDISQVYSWGDGSWGATAHGDLSSRTKPDIVKGAVGKGVVGVSCGWAHTVFLMESGDVWASGHSLGTGYARDACALIKLSVPANVVITQVACGSYHCLARSSSDALLSWGANNYGQLGLGDRLDRTSPTLIGDVAGVVTVACGSNASAFIDVTGHVYTFGQGCSGFTGHGHDRDLAQPRPVSVFGPSNPATIVSCGASHMVAATLQTIYAWGWNACGQLGVGHTNDVWSPVEVGAVRSLARSETGEPPLDDDAAAPSVIVADLDCGDAHTAMIVVDKRADRYSFYTWGMNGHGQCALPRNDKLPFVLAPALVKVPFAQAQLLSVACGAFHTLLQTKKHGLLSSGCNDCGQLGIDSIAEDPAYELRTCRISSKGVISQVASGASHCCLILSESWVDDSDCTTCMACKSAFTRFRRRHHCRGCGGIFCASCSDNRSPILRKGLTAPVRVCAACYAKLSR